MMKFLKKIFNQTLLVSSSIFLSLFAPFRKIKVNSIRFKVSVLYTVVLGVILISFSTVLYTALSYYLYQYTDTRLKLKAEETISTIRAYADIIGDKPGALKFAVQKTFFLEPDYPVRLFDQGKVGRLDVKWQERADVMDLSESVIAFFFADHNDFLTSKGFPEKLLPVFHSISKLPDKSGENTFNNVQYKRIPFRVITMPYMDQANQVHLLHMGISQKNVVQLRLSLLQSMAIGIPLVLLLTSFVGRIFVQRILDPIEEIAHTANQITHEDLASRVKTRHLDAEIAYLVDAFNDMIMRLEKSFKHINEFSSYVAHELKTPLAIIKGESELALNKERDSEEYRAALRINLEEANRMRSTIENLLLLAKLDYQPEGFHFQKFDFTEFFSEICEQAKILVVDKGLVVESVVPQEKIMIEGDILHLRRVFFNLIDNAIKFTQAPGEISLRANLSGKKLIISIADNGMGIAEEDLPQIFEKFYRGDTINGNATLGNGLGLSIVYSIVKTHQGEIHVTSKRGHGTTFHITLPT